MAVPPTEPITFLFTDIEGSTRLWERDASAMDAALARHDEILTKAIATHGGHVFKTVGDAFCCTFAEPVDALSAALAIQRSLHAEEWADEVGVIRVRIAIQSGTAWQRGGDYFGPAVNRVARLLSAGHGGQILVSREICEKIGAALPEGTELRDLGERRVKGLDRLMSILQIVDTQVPYSFPPLRTLDPHLQKYTGIGDLFSPIGIGAGVRDSERIAGPSIGIWKESWIRLQKNKAAVVGLVVIVLLLTLAFVVGPLLTPYTPDKQDLSRGYQGPSGEFWFGTDEFGRDMFARLWQATRVSLYIAFLAAFLDLAVGVTYGAVSGLLGGRVDNVMQRIIEILNGIPSLVVAILVMVVLDPGIITISIAVGLTGWTVMARIVRGRVMQLKDQEFALASLSLGAGRRRLLTKHLIPNALGVIIITVMFTVPSAIFYEAVLSFIGLGIQVPNASLGSLISDGAGEMRFHLHLLLYPALVFSLLMLSFNILGDGLRDSLDPKMRSIWMLPFTKGARRHGQT